MSERDNHQPEQPRPYEPPLHISWDRNVAGEEQHNNIQNVNESMVELINIMQYEQRHGVPVKHLIDDYEGDRTIAVPMDLEWQKMVLWGVGKERKHLEYEGIVFDFRRHSYGEPGDDTA